jgi:hypothetical protein
MVRDPGALRRAPVRISGPVVGGDEKATPGATSRPPLRAIQPPASGGPRWSLPTARKVLGVREGKAPARVGAVSTSVAPRKQGPKLVGRSRLTTAGTSSMDEPCNKVRDAISFWEQNSSNVQVRLLLITVPFHSYMCLCSIQFQFVACLFPCKCALNILSKSTS